MTDPMLRGLDAYLTRSPDPEDPIMVQISAWVSLYPDGYASPEQVLAQSIRDRSIDIRDLDDIEILDIDGIWPDEPDPDEEYERRRDEE